MKPVKILLFGLTATIPFFLIALIFFVQPYPKNSFEEKYGYMAYIESFRYECDTLYWGDEKDKDRNWLRLQLDHKDPPTINQDCIDSMIHLDNYVLRIRVKDRMWYLHYRGNPEKWYVDDWVWIYEDDE